MALAALQRSKKQKPQSRLLLSLLSPAFVNIVLILAPGRAKRGVGMPCHEYFLAMLAAAQRLFIIRQRKAEHHLHAEQQRMKIPYDRRFIIQSDMISGRDATESRHALPV